MLGPTAALEVGVVDRLVAGLALAVVPVGFAEPLLGLFHTQLRHGGAVGWQGVHGGRGDHVGLRTANLEVAGLHLLDLVFELGPRHHVHAVVLGGELHALTRLRKVVYSYFHIEGGVGAYRSRRGGSARF